MNTKKKIRGLRSTNVFIPTIILISVLYVVILVATVFINNYTTKLSEETKNSSDCITTINYIQSTTSKTSETVTAFVHSPTAIDPETKQPVIVNGKEILITGALNAYLEEKNDDNRNPNKILLKLEQYNLSTEVIDYLKAAINAYNDMQREQAHSILLINEVSTIDIPEDILNQLDSYELSSYELSLTDDEKRDVAFENLLKPEYTGYKETISNNIRKATELITKATTESQNGTTQALKWARGFIWGSFLLVLLSTASLFFILLKQLVFPIVGFTKKIDKNETLDSDHALYEANLLAIAYNNLLERHKEFEKDLRNVAEYDSLTNMPNRYCYNEFLRTPVEEDKSTCVLLFDINNLKYVNDTFGHAKGDELIKNASLCIKECFLDKEGKNCYRIGGDEFVAILDNVDEKDIDNYINSFIQKQNDLNVSIAYGYAYSNNVKTIGYEKLIIRADKRMYKKKKEMYKENNINDDDSILS